MSKSFAAIAALSVLTACAAAAAHSQASPGALEAEHTGDVSCDLRFTPTRHTLRIEAFVRSASALAGEYDLVISKSGPSGTSDISQGGPFQTAEGADLALGASEFGIERGDRYRAQLVLRGENGVLCRAERRS